MPTLDTPANFIACIILAIAGYYLYRCFNVKNEDLANKSK